MKEQFDSNGKKLEIALTEIEKKEKKRPVIMSPFTNRRFPQAPSGSSSPADGNSSAPRRPT